MFLAAKKSGSLCMQFVCCILFTELFGGRSGHHEEERHAQMEKSVGDNDMCRAATTKIQAIFRAAMQRRTVSEAAATVAIVVTEGFGDLIGRNDIRHVLNDLQMQKRRLEEKIETIEQGTYYAKATRQKEIRNVTKLGRKKVREIEEQIRLLKEPKATGGGDLDFSGLERQAWQMQAMNK